VDAGGGLKQPIIGTRTVETTVRLQDGETNLLAGLIKEAERKSMTGLPGIEDIPVVRRLFGSDQHEVETSDIVLSITPHIVRVPNVEPIDLVPLWVGTEEKIELRGVARNALGESPFGPGPSPWESIEKELKGEKAGGGSQAAGAKEGAKESAAKPPGSVKTGGKVAAGAAAGAGAAAAKPTTTEPGSTAPPLTSDAPATGTGEAGGTTFEEPPPLTVAQIRLAPERGQVAAGEGVGVDVLIGDARGVGVVNFQLRYDPSVLQFVPPAMAGDFLQQGGVPVDLQAVEGADGGLIVVSAARAGGAGASGAGRLLRLNFVALSEGSAAFSFSAAQVRGPDDQALPVSLRVSDIQVTP
jgi:general secretion pathway protein D